MSYDLKELKKAMSETSITGKLVQNMIDKEIQRLVYVDNPIRSNIPRKPGEGEGSYINQLTALAAAETIADTGNFTAVDPTFGARQELKFKIVGIRGEITTKAQAIGRSYTNLKQQMIENMTLSVKQKEEDLLVTGSVATDATQFNGLKIFFPDGDSQNVAPTDPNGEALTQSKIDEAFDKCLVTPNMIIVNARTRREIFAILQSFYQTSNLVEVKGATKLPSYSGVPIYTSPYVLATETYGTANNASSLYLLNTNYVWVEVLQELKMVQVDSGNSQTERWELYEYIVLVVSNKKMCSRIEGIIPA